MSIRGKRYRQASESLSQGEFYAIDDALKLADNQLRDTDRSRRWSAALVKFCTDAREENKAVIRSWIEDWTPLANKAITAYCSALPESENAAETAISRMEAFHRSLEL